MANRASYLCHACGRNTLHERDASPVNHILHLLITLFLCGLWLPIWLILAASSQSGPMRCLTCGHALNEGRARSTSMMPGLIILAIFLTAGIWVYWESQKASVDAKPAVGPVRFEPPRFRPDPAPAVDPEVERIAPGAIEKPQAEAPEEGPAADSETQAARKLSLARSLTDPGKRRAWLQEIVETYPDTDAARQAAEDLAKVK